MKQASFQAVPLHFTFISNPNSVTGLGYHSVRVTVACAPVFAAPAAFELQTFKPAIGLLLGDHDTIYATIDRTHAREWHGMEGSLSLTRTTSGVDARVYARCNARPTPAAFDLSSEGAAPGGGFLLFPPGYCDADGDRVHVAVNSADGVGSFTLVHSERFPRAVIDLHVGVGELEGPFFTEQLAAFRSELAAGARYAWGVTEGTTRFRDIHFYPPSPERGYCDCDGQACNVCIINATNRCYLASWGTVYMFNNCMAYRVVAHELGHQWMGGSLLGHLPDEYRDLAGVGSPPNCGHSHMGNVWIQNICNDRDHGRDPDPRSWGLGPDDMWEWMQEGGQVPTAFPVGDMTTDWYNYVNADFGGEVGHVIVH